MKITLSQNLIINTRSQFEVDVLGLCTILSLVIAIQSSNYMIYHSYKSEQLTNKNDKFEITTIE